MDPHLKTHQYYVDLYDRQTVKLCRDLEGIGLKTDIPSPDGKEIEEKEKQRLQGVFNELHLYFVTGERYQKKSETIAKWMERDRERDHLFETAEAPRGIQCLTCSRVMFVSSKHFRMSIDDDTPDRVLFFYDCTLNHIPRRAFYDDGEEFKRDKPLCPKCQTALEEEDATTDMKFVTNEKCPNCGYTNTREIERVVIEPEEPDPNFERDRARWCSDAEGLKYSQWMQTLHDLEKVLNKEKEKEKEKDVYDDVARIKRLKIIELEQLLAPSLEKEEYIKLQLKDPEITRDVVVPFTVHDAKQGREERISSLGLQRLIKTTLEDTNWRLMSEGVHYRLGMLEGRLRAYEKEEDLADLVRARLKKVK